MAADRIRPSARPRVVFVDMLRGVAALVVMFHHAFVHFQATFAPLPQLVQHCAFWLSQCNVEAVLLFFVVSGFSIRLSIESLDLGRRADLDEYTYRRLKRILPLYWFALAFGAACMIGARVATDPRALSAFTLAGNLLFLQTPKGIPGNWFVPFADNGPLWSLSYEMFYYLLFPLHVRLVTRASMRFPSALAISFLGIAIGRLLPNPFANFAASYAVWYCGVELAEAYLARAAAPRWLLIASWVALCVARVVLVSATLSALWFGLTLLLLGCALLRVPALPASRATRIGHALIAAFAWVGGFSYALYLLHFPILRALGSSLGTGPGVLALAATASVAIAIAAERLSLRPRYALLKRAYWSR